VAAARTGLLVLTATEPCDVELDGVAVGGTPLRLPLEAGAHDVVAKHTTSSFAKAQRVVIFADQQTAVTVNVPSVAPAPAPAPSEPAPSPAPSTSEPAPEPAPAPGEFAPPGGAEGSARPTSFHARGQMDGADFAFDGPTRQQVLEQCLSWRRDQRPGADFVKSLVLDGRRVNSLPPSAKVSLACKAVSAGALPSY